jgi:hypothetical protein
VNSGTIPTHNLLLITYPKSLIVTNVTKFTNIHRANVGASQARQKILAVFKHSK